MQALLISLVAYVVQLLGIDRAILAKVEQLIGIQTELGSAARESSPFNIEDQVVANGLLLVNGTYGLAAINTSVSLVPGIIQGIGLPTIADVLAAITSVNPVTLPSTPPEGYGGTTFGPVISWQMCSLD